MAKSSFQVCSLVNSGTDLSIYTYAIGFLGLDYCSQQLSVKENSSKFPIM